MIIRSSRSAAAAAVCVAVAALLAGCTSSGSTGSSAPRSASGSASRSTGVPSSSSINPSPTTAASPSTSSAAAGLAEADGTYLLLGSDPETARLYRIGGSRVAPAASATGIGSVSSGGGLVVVGRDSGSAETVEQLRNGRLRSLGIASGFAPALSATGVLAYGVLGGSTTPGISKPGSTTIRVRAGLIGSERVVARLGSGDSLLALAWSEDDLVAMLSDGERARLVALPAGRGPLRGLVPGISTTDAATAVLTGGDGLVATSSSNNRVPAQVVTVPDARPGDLPADWQPVCFRDGRTLVLSRGAELADVTVTASGKVGGLRRLGRLPAEVQGGACG